MNLAICTDESQAALELFNIHAQGSLSLFTVQDLTHLPTQCTLLFLGDFGKSLLESAGLIPKNRTVSSLRCEVIKIGNWNCLISYSPNVKNFDYGRYVDLQTDISLAVRLALTGTLDITGTHYRYVDSFREVINKIAILAETTGKSVEVALDLETLGLDPYNEKAYIITIQISYEQGRSDVVYFKSKQDFNKRLYDLDDGISDDINWLLTSPLVSLRGANLKYDLHWLWVHGGYQCANFRFDTTLVGSLLDENRSNSLDNHTKIYCPRLAGYADKFNKTVDKSRMDLVPKDKLLPYAGGDTDACLSVAKEQKAALLRDKKLTGFYVNILHPAARAFEKVEQGGVFLDKEAFKNLESELKTEIGELITKAKRIIGGRLVYKHADNSREGGLNITKAALLKDFMFGPMGLNLKPKMVTKEKKEASTSLEHLMMFQDVPEAKEFVLLLKDFSSATKTLGTYVEGFKKHIRSDGKFHPSYYFFLGDRDEGEGGTNTGRLSCKDPAFQTIPKHTKWAKKIRRCFGAPPGYLVLEQDYSQGELKIVACIANELTMIESYRKGFDLHAVTGAGANKITYERLMELKVTNPEEYETIRQGGKIGNFGLIYGMSADGFMDYARIQYGMVFTLEEATEFRKHFFILYPELLEYHKNYKSFARKFEQIRSPLGRIRHLPLIKSPMQEIRAKAERQSINSPVQGCLSDMLLWSISLFDRNGWMKESPVFGGIHDAAYTYVPEDRAEEQAKRQAEVMENLPFHLVGWEPQLKFTVDNKIGPNMADLKKV